MNENRGSMLGVLVLTGAVACGGGAPGEGEVQDPNTAAPHASYLAELHTWYSPGRSEYFTTTTPAWMGAPGQTRSPDYQFVRVEARVFRPDRPQPRDTVPLHGWYRDGDNLLLAGSADDAWAVEQGYTRVRLEGYAPVKNLAGMVRLRAYSRPGDQRVTTGLVEPSERYAYWRTQVYVFPPLLQDSPAPELFGYRRLHTEGHRSLLVIVRNDVPSRAGTSQGAPFYRNLFFGPGGKTIAGFFEASSLGRFRFVDAGVVETFSALDNDTSAVLNASSAVDFSRFDRDHDGRVDSSELALVVVNKYDDDCGQTRGVGCVRTDGVDVCLGSVSFLGERVNFSTAAHELTHQLGMYDLYGPGAAWNAQATLAAATCGLPADASFQVDAWHKIAFGWVEPRLHHVINPATVERVATPGAFGLVPDPGKRPIILYSRAYGLDEFLIIEARARDGGYDSHVADDGLAMWHVNLNAALLPADIFFEADSDPALEHIFGVRLFNAPTPGRATGPRPGLGRFLRDGESVSPFFGGRGLGCPIRFEWTDSTRRVGHVLLDDLFRPRLDVPLAVSNPGATLSVPGLFGFDTGHTVYLARAGVETPLTASLPPEGPARVLIPAGAAPGDYTLYLRTSRVDSSSNHIDLRLEAPGEGPF